MMETDLGDVVAGESIPVENCDHLILYEIGPQMFGDEVVFMLGSCVDCGTSWDVSRVYKRKGRARVKSAYREQGVRVIYEKI
jgi:hypothetical protein